MTPIPFLLFLDYPNACYISIILLHPQCGNHKDEFTGTFRTVLTVEFLSAFDAVDQERFERRRPSSLHGQWRPLWQIFLFGRLCQGVVFFCRFVGMVLKRKKVANHRFGGMDWNEKSLWTSDGISTNIERVDEFWLAPVCTSFSAINVGTSRRSPCTPWGDVSRDYIVLGNLLASRSILLAMLATALNGTWFLEQPGSSLLWLPRMEHTRHYGALTPKLAMAMWIDVCLDLIETYEDFHKLCWRVSLYDDACFSYTLWSIDCCMILLCCVVK